MTGRGRSPVTGGRFDLWIPGASMGVVTVTARVPGGPPSEQQTPSKISGKIPWDLLPSFRFRRTCREGGEGGGR